MLPLVYIETSVFSFYHDTRESPIVVANRYWTREWWDHHRQNYQVATSSAALDELRRGDSAYCRQAFAMARKLPVLPLSQEVEEIVDAYVKHKLMPADPLGDALHLALASFSKCDFLMTWNCQNLANARKYGHIRRINTILGLVVPTIVTPMEMISN